MRINNPFWVIGYDSPTYFCDRVQETNTIVDALYNGRNVTLVSPRRMGKSGLIKNVFYQIQAGNTIIEKDAYLFYVDIYNTHCLADFIRQLSNTIIGTFDKKSKKLLRQFVKLISACRPIISYDPITGQPQLSLDIQPNKEENTLHDIFAYLSTADKTCIVAIDEFQQITTYPEKGTEALLRSYIQFMTHTRFIFSGSKQHLMGEMFLSPKRPFFQSTQVLSLHPISQDTYYDFAQFFFTKRNLVLPREVFDTIYALYDGTTWYIQMLLNRLYNLQKSPTQEGIQRVIKEIIAENSDSFSFYYAHLGVNDAKLMRAIAQNDCVKQITAKEFLQKNRLGSASTVQRVIERLTENDWVVETAEGYRVYDYFFAQWLQHQ